MKKYYALFPVLAAIYPSIFLYTSNISELDLTSILPYIGLSIGATLLLMTFFFLLTKSLLKGALYTLPFIIAFYTFGHLELFVIDKLWAYEQTLSLLTKKINTSFRPRVFYSFWISLLYLILLIVSLIKIRKVDAKKVAKLSQAFFATTILLNALALLQLTSLLFVSDKEPSSTIKIAQTIENPNPQYPDIYYLIPDGYPRKDILKKYYNYDNTPFIQALEQKGFFVAEKNYSNYAATFLSLTSSLNMRYINYFTQRNGINSKYARNVFQELANNEVYQYLKKKGYAIYHYQNSWKGAKRNQYADVEIPCLSLKEMEAPFKNLFFNSTALIMLPQKSTGQAKYRCHMNNIEHLKTMPTIPGPKFVFAHFRPPHPPFIFNRKGKWIENDLYTDARGSRVKAWFHFDLFLDQVIFISEQLNEVVTRIQNGTRPAVIIIQSDHGTRIHNNRGSIDFRKARHANFIAISLPDKAKIFKTDLSPVNIFPTIFNYYFNDHLPIHPNKYYYSEYTSPYKFDEMNFPQ